MYVLSKEEKQQFINKYFSESCLLGITNIIKQIHIKSNSQSLSEFIKGHTINYRLLLSITDINSLKYLFGYRQIKNK